MTVVNSVDIVAVYKALADDVRIGMVKNIANSKQPVAGCCVVSSCDLLVRLSQPTASHHFAKLVAAGVLLEEKEGTQKLYTVNTDALWAAGIDIDRLVDCCEGTAKV